MVCWDEEFIKDFLVEMKLEIWIKEGVIKLKGFIEYKDREGRGSR